MTSMIRPIAGICLFSRVFAISAKYCSVFRPISHPRSHNTYELQFDLARAVGLHYAPRQLFSSKLKPPT
jgi:hypothetical protein